MNTVDDWNDLLSGGEKQRIGFARLFYHLPKFALIDEGTSAVSIDIEGHLYEHAKKLGITIITVSHRKTLFKYHDYNLILDLDGGYKLEKISQENLLNK